jgi:hypothetical protein
MKNKKFTLILGTFSVLLTASFLSAANVETEMLHLGAYPGHLQEHGLIRMFEVVSNIFSNKSKAEKLEAVLEAQSYEDLHNSYELALIEAFGQGANSNFEVYACLMTKLAPYLYSSNPSQRDKKFIEKFIEYYHPRSEALEEWQQNTYKVIVATKNYYDQHETFDDLEAD